MGGADRKLTEKTQVAREMDRELKECTITRAEIKKAFQEENVMGLNSKGWHDKI